MNKSFINPHSRTKDPIGGLFSSEELSQVRTFFRRHPNNKPTPLLQLSALAEKIGVKNILVKDESTRMGLNSFKILGVSYAVNRLLSDKRITKDTVLVCATEGNHGRAVAHAARANGLAARIYVAGDIKPTRIEALEKEGAEVIAVKGNYDEAVRQAAHDAGKNGWQVVSDTSWTGYEEIPRLIMAGYTGMLGEAQTQWSGEPPDAIFVQAGVGGLAGAVVSWFYQIYGRRRPFIIICEPDSAACFLESARAGKPVTLKGRFDTIMAGLRCGEVSPLGWKIISAKADAYLTVSDGQCQTAMRLLAHPPKNDIAAAAGASGACGLGGLLAVMQNEQLSQLREHCRIDCNSRIFLINTEGATDPQLYSEIVG